MSACSLNVGLLPAPVVLLVIDGLPDVSSKMLPLEVSPVLVTVELNVAAPASLITNGKVLSVTLRITKPLLVTPDCPPPTANTLAPAPLVNVI